MRRVSSGANTRRLPSVIMGHASVLNSRYTPSIIPGVYLRTDVYARVLSAHAFAYHYRRCRRYYIIMIVIVTRT